MNNKAESAVPDYSNFQTPAAAPASEVLVQAGKLAHDQVQLERQIAAKEEELKNLKRALEEVSEKLIPDLLTTVGLESFKTTDGLEVNLKDKVFCSISEVHAPQAYGWLEEHGQAGLIKRQFVIEFTKNQDAWADKFERDLKQRKLQLNVQRKKSVHPSTLKSFVTESLKDGVDLPQELFGVHQKRISIVK